MARMGKGILVVKLIDAKGLKNTDLIGKIDPYVIIQYRNQERKSTVARGQGRNPSWNETFEFIVYSAGADHQQNLTLRIMDKDTFSADDFLGSATVNVADVIALGFENGKGELRPTKYRVVLADQTYCGEIQVAVTFTTTMEPENEEEFGGYKHSFHA